VAPLRLGGLRGKKSTPSVWLGGTGELLRSASRSSWEQEQLGEGAAGASEPLLQQVRPRYVTKTIRAGCMVSLLKWGCKDVMSLTQNNSRFFLLAGNKGVMGVRFRALGHFNGVGITRFKFGRV
jgi:hypothetical protein